MSGVSVEQYRLLMHGTVESLDQIPWGSNYTFRAALRLGDEEALAVYKPRRGERPLWDFPDGTLFLREFAAYVTSQALGWPFIPATIIRDGPHGVGSMQLWVEAEPLASFGELQEVGQSDLARIAAFDIITNNADRKGGHVLQDAGGKLWGIDHGLCFNAVPKVRTVLQHYCGQALPAPVREDLQAFRSDHLQGLRLALEGVLAPEELEAFTGRLDRLVAEGTYPTLDHYRSVPWPPF